MPSQRIESGGMSVPPNFRKTQVFYCRKLASPVSGVSCETTDSPSLVSTANSMNRLAHQISTKLAQPVDNTFLVYFRIAFGALLVWSLCGYFHSDLIWTEYLEPRVHFSYFGFDWVKPWSGYGMYAHFLITAIAAACILVGFKYKLATKIFFLGYAFIFLLDQTWYLNHCYLICLIGFLLTLLPAHNACSIDAKRDPTLRADTVPTWVLWLLRFQIGVPYFFGGIAKLNSDWLHGEPLRTWLAKEADFPIIGQFFTAEWCVTSFVWGGLLLDLFIVPLLFWRRTRWVALAAVWCFHGMNSQLFNIGIFPWLMLAATTLLYLPADWVARLRFWKPLNESADGVVAPRFASWVKPAVCAFVIWQLVMPFRHFLYPGHVAFTREGHPFSWRMKLNIRRVKMQLAVFYEDGSQEPVDLWNWLTHPQSRRVRSTDQILQLAETIREHKETETQMRAEVRGTITVALNGRDPIVLVNDTFDLSRQSRSLAAADWIERPEIPSLAVPQTQIAEIATQSTTR